ncbi:MAG: PhzF family phenazine biosynthesis isomerase [Cyanobacteriota bacterium]|nr:PhzF family phenazine biosynthesis isomerase [Cyanobacteriota bacterium]
MRALLIEAFSEVACQGNGAAVVLLPAAAEATWMQALARSLNQSETAFLLQSPEGWMLRWFTPSCEVPLCGHATLAALLALGHWGYLDANAATVFRTRSGALPVARAGGSGQIELPASPWQSEPLPAGLREQLRQAGLSEPLGFWRSAIGYCVVLLRSADPLQHIRWSPAALPNAEAMGLVLMQALDSSTGRPQVLGRPADYQLRFFAPGLGIDEDPVTGSAHALVARYWLETLGRSSVVGWQCSPRSGGMLCEAASSGMIRLTGAGSVLWQGDLLLPLDASSAAAESWHAACASG